MGNDKERRAGSGIFTRATYSPDGRFFNFWDLNIPEAIYRKTTVRIGSGEERTIQEIRNPEDGVLQSTKYCVSDWVNDVERVLEVTVVGERQTLAVSYFPHGDPDASYKVRYRQDGAVEGVSYVFFEDNSKRQFFFRRNPTTGIWFLTNKSLDRAEEEKTTEAYKIGTVLGRSGFYFALKPFFESDGKLKSLKLAFRKAGLEKGKSERFDNSFIVFPADIDISAIARVATKPEDPLWLPVLEMTEIQHSHL